MTAKEKQELLIRCITFLGIFVCILLGYSIILPLSYLIDTSINDSIPHCNLQEVLLSWKYNKIALIIYGFVFIVWKYLITDDSGKK